MTVPTFLILFVDIRGFTNWSERTEVAPRITEFLGKFEGDLLECFPDETIKTLGDGALIFRALDAERDPSALLSELLEKIKSADAIFDKRCGAFATSAGVGTGLHLGWGVVRGAASYLNPERKDVVGHNVNKAARLCAIARPRGIALDAEDFPEVDQKRFTRQRRKLEGIGPTQVWVTEAIASRSIPREEFEACPEVHVAGVCIREQQGELQVLIARRSPRRQLFPGLIAGCGGQLLRGERFEDGVARHHRAELGLTVTPHADIYCHYVIREPEVHVIPGVRMLCEAKKKPRKPPPDRYAEVKFVSLAEFRTLPEANFIPGLRSESLKLIDQFVRKQKAASKRKSRRAPTK